MNASPKVKATAHIIEDPSRLIMRRSRHEGFAALSIGDNQKTKLSSLLDREDRSEKLETNWGIE
eukprot:scaffold1051_cov81-Skeletonema_dohrnii-CCMP3373.AAC.2